MPSNKLIFLFQPTWLQYDKNYIIVRCLSLGDFVADINLIHNFLIPSSGKIKIITKSLKSFQNPLAWKNAHNGNVKVYSLFSWEVIYSYEPIIVSFLISGTTKDLNMFQIFNWWKFKDWKMAKCDESLESSFSFPLVGFPVSMWVQILLLSLVLNQIWWIIFAV